ncbi:MAG: hypothetical protein UT67_C0004G0002 [Candidatus Magasanikbacteria bacterium GW2011_GWA2_40_10]|uniref:Uncharacterized protein n=1 Tax=Candidatus Magasanikbacteria bacterium GW2011_GWA2_40_10 TaxID=1619037 RepID=A0A0G0Q4E6_9BACT|nr:MAG: hypothetical protein UT67_C0004G0002 [Candidatus Magasanikbacteria bacterium GW2011_GWA2_40_10]
MEDLMSQINQIVVERIESVALFLIRLIATYIDAIWALLFERYPFEDEKSSSIDDDDETWVWGV